MSKLTEAQRRLLAKLEREARQEEEAAMEHARRADAIRRRVERMRSDAALEAALHPQEPQP